MLYPQDTLDVDHAYTLVLDIYDAATETWSERQELQFPGERGPAVSFSFPIKSARGRLLFPGMRQRVDANGQVIHFRDCWAPVDEVVTILGEYRPDGSLAWRLGRPLRIAPR